MKVGRGQVVASFVLLALTAIPVFVSLPFSPGTISIPEIPCSVEKAGTIAVELSGSSGRDGIYYVPKGTTLSGLLNLAGIAPSNQVQGAALSAILKTATTVCILTGPRDVRIEPMNMPKRLALGIPIDINRLSIAEMMLVPGIGEKTAERILEYRAENGPFRSLDDLTEVKGIKEKRLEKLRPFLCVGC